MESPTFDLRGRGGEGRKGVRGGGREGGGGGGVKMGRRGKKGEGGGEGGRRKEEREGKGKQDTCSIAGRVKGSFVKETILSSFF